MSGLGLLAGFLLLAGLMAARLLPALLALPLFAGWVALSAGVTWVDFLNKILLAGSLKLGGAIAVVIFGAMFARVIWRTGISAAIIRQAAELAGDRPFSLALLLTAATAFVFVGMSGLGAVIMAGSIALPLLTGAGVEPADAAALMLLGLNAGLLLNTASYGTYIGIFGGEAAASYYLPAAAIAILGALAYLWRYVPPQESGVKELARLVGSALRFLLCLPLELCRAVCPHAEEDSLLMKRREIPAAAQLAPLLPLVVVFGLRFAFGFGKGQLDPSAAAMAGFLLAALYAALLTAPGDVCNILTGAVVEGIRDVAGVIFLFFGIGMLAAAVTLPEAARVLQPLLLALLPENGWGVALLFALLAPAALYRGPLNMYGMGAGLAALVTGLGILPAEAACGLFLSVGYVQTVSDPTNSHNSWLAGFAGVEPELLLRRTLPYSWGMCLALLAYVALCRW